MHSALLISQQRVFKLITKHFNSRPSLVEAWSRTSRHVEVIRVEPDPAKGCHGGCDSRVWLPELRCWQLHPQSHTLTAFGDEIFEKPFPRGQVSPFVTYGLMHSLRSESVVKASLATVPPPASFLFLAEGFILQLPCFSNNSDSQEANCACQYRGKPGKASESRSLSSAPCMVALLS